jgi:hypothetical protein
LTLLPLVPSRRSSVRGHWPGYARHVPVETGNPGESRSVAATCGGMLSCKKTAQHACTRSPLSSGSRIRILPGAPDQRLCGISNACCWEPKACPEVMTHAMSKRRSHGEDSIYRDASWNRYIGAVDLGLNAAGRVSGKRSQVRPRSKSATSWSPGGHRVKAPPGVLPRTGQDLGVRRAARRRRAGGHPVRAVASEDHSGGR